MVRAPSDPAGEPLRLGVVMPLATRLGGAETMLLRLLTGASSGRVAYHLALLEDGPFAAELEAKAASLTVLPAGHLRQVGRTLATSLRLAAWRRARSLDGVLSWMAKAHLYAGPAALLGGCTDRTVWFLHGILQPPGSVLDRAVLALPCREVWCGSRVNERSYRMAARRPRPTRLIYPAVDTDVFDPQRLPAVPEARRQLGLDPLRPCVGMVARLERWKGCHTFLQAAVEVLRAQSEVQFVVVGADHFGAPGYRQELLAQVRQAGIAASFALVGHQENVPMWMQACDICVNASMGEPFGMVVVEAMALGKVVVVPGWDGPAEAVEDGVSGYHHDGTAAGLASVLKRLLAQPPQQQALATAARARAMLFDSRHLAQAVEAAALELWGGGVRAARGTAASV